MFGSGSKDDKDDDVWPKPDPDDGKEWPPAQASQTPSDSTPTSAHPGADVEPPTPTVPTPGTQASEDDFSGYESPDDDFDLVRDDAENEKLRFIRSSQKPHRYHGLNAKTWYCDSCRRRIDTYDPHYHCSDCEDYDLCYECYQAQKGTHLHHGENWFNLLTQPNWFTVGWIMEDESRHCNGVIERCFTDYAPRRFIGTRKTPADKLFEWRTYDDVYNMSVHVANGLTSPRIGLTRKTKQFVGILSSIRAEVPALWFGCNFSGIPFVPIQQILSQGEKVHILKQCIPKVIFCETKHIQEVLDLRKVCPDLLEIVILLDADQVPKDRPLPGFMTFREFLRIGEARSADYKIQKLDPDDLICVIYTSGTTGVPKGIVFRERAWLIELTRANSTLPLVIYGFLPFSHVSGMSDILVSFFNGGRCGLLCQSDLKNLFGDFKILRPTILSTIPRLLNFVYNEFHRRAKREKKQAVYESMTKVFGDRLIEICVGSAYCSNKVKRFIRRLCRVPLYDGYGVSEVGTVAFDYKVADGVATKLLDCPELGYLSTDKPFPRGELLVKNKLTAELEYYQSKEITASRFDTEGFFHTGDIVEMRGPRIVIIDRRNNILKLAQGEFVSLEKVEAVLETSPLIDQIVAFANPSKTKLVGIVVVFDGAVDKDHIFADMRQTAAENQLNAWEVPAFIHLTTEKLPLTELKKKSRRRIKAKFKDALQALFRESQKKEGDKFEVFLADLLEVQKVDPQLTWKEMGGTSFKSVPLLDELESLGFPMSYRAVEEMKLGAILDIIRGAADIVPEKPRFKRDDLISLDEDRAKMTELVGRLRQVFPVPAKKKQTPEVIFLTGASGFLGGSVLTGLRIQFPRARIVCLVRKSSADKIASNAMLQVQVGDLAKPFFGMEEAAFESLQREVDLIVHCGAMVNHFVSYTDHYDANVRSAYDIVRLSCGYKPIVYVSTISVYVSEPQMPSLEQEPHKHGEGYAASKWAADVLLSHYCRDHVSVIRPSLICGSARYGHANTKDWLNGVLHGMFVVGAVPTQNLNGAVPFDMVTVDDVAACTVSLAKAMKGNPKAVDVSFPNVTLDDLCAYMVRYYVEKKGSAIKRLPFPEWLKVVQPRKKLPMAPFVKALRPDGFFGMNKFVPTDMSRFDEVMGAGYIKKLSYEGFKKIMEYLLSQM